MERAMEHASNPSAFNVSFSVALFVGFIFMTLHFLP